MDANNANRRAVDLGALRGRREARKAVLAQLSLICSCGRRVRSKGFQAVLVDDDAIGPNGELGLITSMVLCGEDDCKRWLDVKPMVLASRAIPATKWWDE